MKVSIVIPAIHVSSPVYGLKFGQGTVRFVIGRISNHAAFPIGHSREILELLLGLMKQEFLTCEPPKDAATFISRFMKMKGEFPQSDFRAPRWVYSTVTSWWVKMVYFVLKELEEPLL